MRHPTKWVLGEQLLFWKLPEGKRCQHCSSPAHERSSFAELCIIDTILLGEVSSRSKMYTQNNIETPTPSRECGLTATFCSENPCSCACRRAPVAAPKPSSTQICHNQMKKSPSRAFLSTVISFSSFYINGGKVWFATRDSTAFCSSHCSLRPWAVHDRFRVLENKISVSGWAVGDWPLQSKPNREGAAHLPIGIGLGHYHWFKFPGNEIIAWIWNCSFTRCLFKPCLARRRNAIVSNTSCWENVRKSTKISIEAVLADTTYP